MRTHTFTTPPQGPVQGYLWDAEPHLSPTANPPWICVIPPLPNSPTWTSFVQQFPPARRRYLKDDGLDIWMFSPEYRAIISQRFTTMGWFLNWCRPAKTISERANTYSPPNGAYSELVYDPYRVLHVTRDAPKLVVSAAFRALSRSVHPDTNEGKGSPKKLQEYTEAKNLIYEEKGWV